MTYKINGVEFTLQPTEGLWVFPDFIGIDGNGHPIYPATKQFEITWSLISAADAKQIYDFVAAIGSTGTAVVDLPDYNSSTYTFKSYSGCVLYFPSVGPYFYEHQTDLTLIVGNIKT